MPRARFRFCAKGRFWFLTHDGFIPHSPSIGASLVSAADEKSAGGSTAPHAARAFVSAPASTATVIAGPGASLISIR
ncbi:hypothetical protein [Microvirga sp. BSC39]|uniref:hypothetical protein n=1 Tax=Microvirga sp. BSC39 TaxID=1549810 RepID=UPI0004E94565|nr:hypothetical protein [Microvirga sp. BSC39]KFG68679.1 hypothetical protein JH26_14480 [Microvirga sp. BSC39]